MAIEQGLNGPLDWERWEKIAESPYRPLNYEDWGKEIASMVEKAREAATKGNINALRGATSIYYGDHEGVFPKSLATSPDSPFSLYMQWIPSVRATHMGIGAGFVEAPYGNSVIYTDDERNFEKGGTGWRYNPKTGHVFVNSASIDSRGVPYSTYGY